MADEEDDDDPYPWRDVLWVFWLAVALFGGGAVLVWAWSLID